MSLCERGLRLLLHFRWATRAQRAVHYLLDEHPQNPQNPCSKKTKSHPSELHFRWATRCEQRAVHYLSMSIRKICKIRVQTNEKSPFRVSFPLSHTLRATCGTLPFNEHPQNPQNPCSNKRKVTLQSFISAEPHVESNVRYIAFPLRRPSQTRNSNLVSPLSCLKNQKYP